MPVTKLTIQEFSQKIKAKYPEYKDIDDSLLTQKITDKYPEYKDMVHFDVPKTTEQSQAAQPFPVDVWGAGIDKSQEEHASAVNESIPKLADIVAKHGDNAIDKLTGDAYQKSIQQQNLTSETQPVPKVNIKRLPWQVDEERNNFKEVAAQNPDVYRDVLKEIKRSNPKLASDINASLYATDSKDRVGNAPKILENIQALKNGEIDYDPIHKQLKKEQSFFPSIVSGLKEHSKLMDDYNFYATASPSEIIKKFADDAQINDPDAVTNKPSSIGEMLGSSAVPLGKATAGAIAAGVTGGTAAAAAAPWVAALASSPDAYKINYAATLPQRYKELTDHGMEPEEALAKAKSEAAFSGTVGIATNAAMTATGVKMASRQVAANLTSGSFKEIASAIIKNQIKHGLPEISYTSALAGLGKAVENINQGKDTWEGVADAAGSNALLMGLIMGASAVGKSAFHPKAHETIVNKLTALPDPLVNEGIGKAVQLNIIKPEQADALTETLGKQRELNKGVPFNVPEGNKQKIKDLIAKRDDLSFSIDPENPNILDKAFHKDIKEQIDGVKKEKADGTTEGKDGLNEKIRQLSEPVKEEPFEVFKSPIEQGKEIIEKAKVNDVDQNMAKDPEKFMEYLADQVHSGNRTMLEQSDGITKKLLDLSVEAYPEHIIREPKVSVIRPEENAPPNVVPLKEPNVKVIQPSENKAPNIVNLKSQENALQGHYEKISQQHPAEIEKLKNNITAVDMERFLRKLESDGKIKIEC